MRRLFSFLFSNPAAGGSIVFGTVFIHLLGLAPAFYVTLVFSRYMVHGLDATLMTLTSGAIVAMLMERLLRRARSRMVEALIARDDRERSTGIIERLLQAPMERLQDLAPGERAQLMRSVEQVQQALTPPNVGALLDAPFSLVFWVVLLFVSWPLGLSAAAVTLATLGVVFALTFRLRQGMRNLQQAQQRQLGMMASAERLETVRIANAGRMLTSRFTQAAADVRLARLRSSDAQDRIGQVIQVGSGLMTLVTIGLGAKLATLGVIDLGVLFGVNILAARMLALAVRPAQFLNVFVQAAQALEIIDARMAMPLEAREGTRLAGYSGRLEFKDVSFGYSGGTAPLFENLFLHVSPGDLIVVTGGNGTGKTTFSRLIAGLINPTRGAILADGVDLRQFVPRWWRRQMVFVPQEPSFFDGTLRENLSTLAPRVTPDTLKQLLAQVGAAAFVDQHPKGLQMPVTQGGAQLSPGIRRRLALVRALTTQGRLVVLDEPTEGLDPQGIAMMNAVIAGLRKDGRTVILCTQMPSPDLNRMATVIDLGVKPEPRVVRPTQSKGNGND